jgi:UDP-N-acetylglucosamine--N-acetylmuramyl-(pentapeptide) pyrophosphoryl-undecaprenol N-acetylglucosamine transferase
MFPARAFADEMRARGWTVGLISDYRGLRYASDFPAEWKEEVNAASPNFRKPWTLPAAALKIKSGINRAVRLIDQTKPALVAGFGGYPAYPALAAAKKRKVPIIIHEQNAVLGRVNRQFAQHAKLVASGFNRLDFLPPGAAHRPIGNPVRATIIAMRDTPYPPTDGKLVLFVTGGSQGSSIIGDTVPLAIANYVPESLRGRLKGVRNIYRRAQVDADLAPFFADMPERLASAHLVVARSGAGTVSELAVVGRPSILIPLAIAMDDHQSANAEALTDVEAADVILEINLYPKLLGSLIAVRLEHGDDLRQRAAAAKSVGKVNAASDLADMAERVAEL